MDESPSSLTAGTAAPVAPGKPLKVAQIENPRDGGTSLRSTLEAHESCRVTPVRANQELEDQVATSSVVIACPGRLASLQEDIGARARIMRALAAPRRAGPGGLPARPRPARRRGRLDRARPRGPGAFMGQVVIGLERHVVVPADLLASDWPDRIRLSLVAGLSWAAVRTLLPLGQGLEKRRIAERTAETDAVVKATVRRVLAKLHCRYPTEAALFAHRRAECLDPTARRLHPTARPWSER